MFHTHMHAEIASRWVKKEEEKLMIETIITLSRLNCGGCVRNVTNALQTLAGVEIVQTDIPSRTVHLRYFDDQITLEQIKSVLAEAHYLVINEQRVHQQALTQAKAEV